MIDSRLPDSGYGIECSSVFVARDPRQLMIHEKEWWFYRRLTENTEQSRESETTQSAREDTQFSCMTVWCMSLFLPFRQQRRWATWSSCEKETKEISWEICLKYNIEILEKQKRIKISVSICVPWFIVSFSLQMMITRMIMVIMTRRLEGKLVCDFLTTRIIEKGRHRLIISLHIITLSLSCYLPRFPFQFHAWNAVARISLVNPCRVLLCVRFFLLFLLLFMTVTGHDLFLFRFRAWIHNINHTRNNSIIDKIQSSRMHYRIGLHGAVVSPVC
jgi:hypothetical protein